VARFVVDGLAMDEPVLVAVPGDELALLRDVPYAGGESPATLQLADITEVARNPSRFMAIQGAAADDHPGRLVRIVSQLALPGRTEEEFVACVEHEALVNDALDGHRATGLCRYDATRLGDDVLADARDSPPGLWRCGSLPHSADYAPADVLQRCNQPLPVHPEAVTSTVGKSADLRPARSFAVDYADWVGLSPTASMIWN